jgi:hypothetical protein
MFYRESEREGEGGGKRETERVSFIGDSIFSAGTSITHIQIDAINLPPLVVHQNLKRFILQAY